MAESDGLKSLLVKVKEESEKGGLKLNIQKTKIMVSRLNTSQQIDGEKMETVADFIFLGSKMIVDGDCSHEIKRCFLLGTKAMTNLDSIFKKQRHHFADKGLYSQRYGFSSSHGQTGELDHNEGQAPKMWCFWIVELEKTLENPLDSKEVKPVKPKGNQAWIFIGRTDAEAEAPILCPPDVKTRLTGKDPNAGKDWRQKEKGVIED